MSKQQHNWINKLLSSDGVVSSKRFAGIFTLINILVFCYLAIFGKTQLPEYMFEGICLLTGGLLGVTVFENIFKKSPPNNTNNNEPQPPSI